MMQILKAFKHCAKLIVVIVVMFTIATLINQRFSPRIERLTIRKMNYHAFNPKQTFKTDKMKYILIWFKGDKDWDFLKESQYVFKDNNCSCNNCYITRNRNFLGGDYRQFDAILFNGKFLSGNNNATFQLPEQRFLKQFYVFAMRESADNYPSCNSKFDHYFNLTWTYRLDSDAVWPYFTIYDALGNEIGPKYYVGWPLDYKGNVNKNILNEKKYIAIWFVSNCNTNSKRERVFNEIKLELLNKHKLNIEVVGNCGSRECLRKSDMDCLRHLKKYYFYFAFENSIADYYVTEKVLNAFLHDTVPIVYGGADYSSFLPPGSYIDAKELGTEETAAIMAYLVKNHTAYLEYFRWKNHYRYTPANNAVCKLCRLLNKDLHRVYADFRRWWNPDYKKTCKRLKYEERQMMRQSNSRLLVKQAKPESSSKATASSLADSMSLHVSMGP